MPISDLSKPSHGLTAVAIGGGPGIAPLDHLGPHNALEWVLYLALLAIFAAVVIHEWRNRNAIPGFRKPRRRNDPHRPSPPASGSPVDGPDQPPEAPDGDP